MSEPTNSDHPAGTFRYLGVALDDAGIELRITKRGLKSGRIDALIITEEQAFRLVEDVVEVLRLGRVRDER